MHEFWQVYAIAITLYESAVYVWFLDQFQERRFPRWITILLILALQLLSNEIIHDNLRFALEILCDLFVLLITYKGKAVHSAIYPIVFYAMMFLGDTVCATLICLMNGIGLSDIDNVSRLQILVSIMSRALLPLFIFLLIKLWPKEQLNWYYLYPIPLTIVAVQLFFSPYGKETLFYTNPKWLYMLVVIFMYASMLYVVLAQREHHKRSEYMHKLKIMDIHNAEQLRYINEIQCAYKSLSKHIHDARHHLDLLNTYIKSNKWTKAKSYLSSLYSELSSVVASYTGNADIDSIIFSKQIAFPNVKINVSGLLPESIIWLETVDICVLLANALTNAAQACDGIMGAMIDVEFLYRDWLIISIKNPYIKPPLICNGRYVSPKGEGHGLGIENMQAIAEKYNGHLLIESTDEQFKLDIMLHKRRGSHGVYTQ